MALNLTSPGTDAALTSDVTGNEHVVHHRDADRAALLAALAALDPDAGLGAIVTALAGTLAVSAASLPLPTGAATQTTLAAILAKIIAAPATEAKQDALVSALAGTLAVRDADVGEYETVAASQADQVMGATGAAGDLLSGLLVIPATTSPGAVSIKDGAGTAITVFTGGASSVSNLVPFYIPLTLRAGTNWKVTTGANVSVIASGNFT